MQDDETTRRSTIARALAAAACALACVLPARAQTIQLMVGGVEKQIYLPVALADRLGYFREQGLDVHVLSDTSGGHAEDGLLTGSVQGVVGFYDHTIDLQAKGKFVQAVVQFSQAPGEAVVVAARRADAIRSPADFRGHALGVTGLGSSTHLLMQYLVAQGGIRKGEVTIAGVGAGDAFAQALREGRIDVGMTTEPTLSRLLKAGDARLLVDLRTPEQATSALGGIYPAACLYLSSPWISTHREDVQRLVNALVKSLRFIAAHSAQEIAAQLPAEYMAGDRALYVSTLQQSKSMFIADGVMPADGPANVLRVMRVAERAVVGKPIDLSRTYTTEFAQAAR
ncbi:ABC transporter substrate-binding protein [Scleromatobacter humisilvae]|uniref:ABC transporter substrate-binding protein n=1 Tax=Scleromatobacter humisilvae TaxID=2897159 RepID=A0A9X1YF31_9BURK|nr:ABC transporter substrate-binding protein [Scleromatobacter humisilvae]MCK9685329.1 ABC transporter substrate-binding protein [Scleromatobacter humisilvae]